MKGIILAAGAGTRLGSDINKCLNLVGSATILQRQIRNLVDAGVSEFVIVLGYREEVIREYISREILNEHENLTFSFPINDRFLETNTASSLEIALRSCREDDVVFCNGDVVFEGKVLNEFVKNIAPTTERINVFVQHKECGEEEIKVTTNGFGVITRIGKDIATDDAEGEGIGINYVPALLVEPLIEQLSECTDTDFFEKAFDIMASRGQLEEYNIGDSFAIEIDFIEDLNRAKEWAEQEE